MAAWYDSHRPGRRAALIGAALAGVAFVLGGFKPKADRRPTGKALPTRSWRMGFSHNPARPTVKSVIAGINMWSSRADCAIIHDDIPWADLLAGMSPRAILERDKVELVKFMRGKGLRLAMMLDITNGLARESEAPALVKAGRSLSEPAVQALVRDYALAVEVMLAPDWLGLAAETNLVRRIAPPALYLAVRECTALMEKALTAAGARSLRYVSVQAEAAWGHFGDRGKYIGIAQDLAEFPFAKALGISSYPYLAYADPADIPLDYYTRLKGKIDLPVFITEGGWTSASVGPVKSSAAKQASYIARHAELLDSVQAIGCFQLQFADFDLKAFHAAVPGPFPPSLQLFSAIGLADKKLKAKPALAEWDRLFARKWTG